MDDPPPAPKRLRILALHSFRTSAAIFEDQLRRAGILTGGGGGGGKDGANSGDGDDASPPLCFAGLPAIVAFLDAPNAASGPPPPDVMAGKWPPPYREWFAATRIEDGGMQESEGEGGGKGGGEGGGCAANNKRRYRFVGLAESERRIARALRETPYDGLVGFSQGAAMAAAMVAMQLAVRRTAAGTASAGAADDDNGRSSSSSSSKSDPWAHLRADLAAAHVPSFLVCIGAAMAPHPRHLLAFSVAGAATVAATAAEAGGASSSPLPLPLPTAHLIGATDPVRPFPERLAKAFDTPLVLHHARGHVVPRLDEAQGRRLRAFLEEARGGGRGGGGAGEGAGPPPPRSRL